MDREQSVHLTEYYYILAKHKSLIIASLVITVTLTMLFTFLMKPVYRATTTMVIEKEQNTSPLTGERVDYESYISQTLTFNTHFKLIKSRGILEKVIKNLRLDRLDMKNGLEAGPLKKLRAQFKENIRLLLGLEEQILTPQQEMAQRIEKLKDKIDIEEVRDTRILKVSVENSDSVMARDMANEVAGIYIKFNIAGRLQSSQSSLSWMSDQLYEMKKKLEDAEHEFLNFKQQEKLFSVEGKQKVIDQKIEEFNDAYIEARNNRLELDAKLAAIEEKLHPGEYSSHVRSIIANPLIDNLYGQMLDSELEFNRLGKVFKSKHPKIIQIKSKIEKTRIKMDEEITKEVENLKTERAIFLAREKVLEKTMADFEDEALNMNKKELNYSILLRNVDANKNLYDTLLSKVKESTIVGNIDVSNIRIAEKATSPFFPIKPKKMLNLILSIIFGLMTGIGLAFLWEYMDRSLRTEEDVERYLGLPVLSVIPLAQDQGKKKKRL